MTGTSAQIATTRGDQEEAPTRPGPADRRSPQGVPALRALFAYLVLGVSFWVATSIYAASIPAGGEPWMAGDWFINYAGGFVRRGLFGELFLQVAPPGAAGLWVLFAVQLAFYAVVVLYAIQVLHRTAYSWSSIALICGPAALPFIGWDPDGGFRKEIITFAALALLAWARWPRRRSWEIVLLVVVAAALFVLGVFSWEASALLLPAALYLLLAGGAPHRGLDIFRRSAAAVFVVIAAVGAGLGTLAHGDVATASAVCEAVREHGFIGPEICGTEATGGGGIEAIGWTSERAQADVAASFPLYAAFLPFIALALVPAVASRWFRTNWGWAVLVALGVLPLYVVVTDYGRWTHVLVIALTFCMTAGDPHRAFSRIWAPLATVLYVSMWALPHHLAPTSGWPWLGFARTVVDQSIEILGVAMGRVV